MGVGALLLLAAGCSGFRYENLSAERYPVTREVAWLAEEPSRPYIVIAKFRGAEMSLCPPSQPYCSLFEEARRQGADAIWLRRREPWTRPEQWVMIQGRMTRIPAETHESIEGVLVRYK
jgi:hypothetical protein